MNDGVDSLRDSITSQSDGELLRMVGSGRDAYRPEVIVRAWEELRERGLGEGFKPPRRDQAEDHEIPAMNGGAINNAQCDRRSCAIVPAFHPRVCEPQFPILHS